MKNLLVILMVWQVTSAQESCPGLLDAPLGQLLDNIPISNYAPSLPSLSLPSDCSSYLPSLPNLDDCGYSSFPSLPSLPSLPELDDCDAYPYFPEPLPYQKKKCCLAKSFVKVKFCSCLKPWGPKGFKYGAKKCGCGLKQKCGLKLKVKKIGNFGALAELPCEIPSLLSDALSGGLDDCY